MCKGDSAAVTLVTDSSFIVAAGAGMLEGCSHWSLLLRCVPHYSDLCMILSGSLASSTSGSQNCALGHLGNL